MGTAAYMAPEQARGEVVDSRADVWAFGAVLYEMLSGKRPFRGESPAELVAGILKEEPDVSKVPAKVQRLIRTCLERYPKKRIRNIGDGLRLLVDLPMEIGKGEGPDPRKKRWKLVAGASMALAFLAIGAAWWMRGPNGRSAPAVPRNTTFLQLTDQPGQELYPSLAPDGKSFVYASRASGNWDIYSQRVGGKNPVNLTSDSTADDTQPAFSPDGEQIAFRSDRDGGGIFVMGATGENVKRITDFGMIPHGRRTAGDRFRGDNRRPGDTALQPSQLFTVNVATSEERAITPRTGIAMQPQWSPYAYRVASGHGMQGRLDVWTIPAAGGRCGRGSPI